MSETPTDAILNPLSDLIEEKESEILETKNAFLTDDAIVENVVLTEEIADNTDTNAFQLLYIKDEVYYLIHTKETGELKILDKYDADDIPTNLDDPTNLLIKFIKKDIEMAINSYSNADVSSEVDEIVSKLIANIIAMDKDKEKLKALLIDADEDIKKILNEYSIKITEKVASGIETKIFKKLDNNNEPSAKLLADYLNYNGSFFLEYETRKRYMKVKNGFDEITVSEINKFFNDEFGYNQISEKKGKEVLGFITRQIKRNYNLIQFTNGTLNTYDEIFYENEFYEKELPKLKVPFPYTDDAEDEFKASKLFAENHAILKSYRWDWNEELFYKAVGSCGFAINEIEKLIVIVGKPDSRKSTLLAILKRIFNYSELKLQTIAENPRFQLLPCIAKDINIDDDMQNFRIDKIGFLNTFISGNGGEVEIKGENIGAKLKPETTPVIFGASNTLPSIYGDGFERRLLLILAENTEFDEIPNKKYIHNILDGIRDEEIGLLFSYSLQEYFKTRDKRITTKEQEKAMNEEWEWKSYPAKKGAELMFIDEDTFIEKLEDLESQGKIRNIRNLNKWQISYERIIDNGNLNDASEVKSKVEIVETYVAVSDVNKKFKKFHNFAFESGKIFKEQKKPNPKVIRSAMGNNGFSQVIKNFIDKDGEKSSERVYEDCIDINQAIGFVDWKKML